MRRHTKWSALVASLSLASGLTLITIAPSHAASGGHAQPRTAADLEAVVAPLRSTGYALDEEGRKSTETSVYAGTSFDTAAGKVDLYLADTGQYQRFLGAARTRRNVDASLIHVHPAKYSHAKLVSARDLVFTQDRLKFGFATNSFAVPEDGSGLIVGVADAADQPLSATQMSDAAAKLTAAAGIPVTVQYAKPSRSMDRTGDTPPYYAGGLIQVQHQNDGSFHYCSTGFTEHANGTTYVFTAAHCAHAGDKVFNGNGVYEGTTIAKNDASDSAAIDARGAQYEFDGGQTSYNVFSYSGTEAPIQNDVVYQDGYYSGIKASQITTTYACWYASSSYGWTNSCGSVTHSFSGSAVLSGDSGALVFHCDGDCNTGGRHVSGLVSASYQGYDSQLAYTTVHDILNYWGGTVW